MNKVIKEHTVKRYHYETLESLKHHLMSFLLLYNHQRKLKALKYQTPYHKIIALYQGLDDEDKTIFFKSNPDHKTLGLNNEKVTVSYKPATPADEQVLASYLPTDPYAALPTSLPAYLIQMIPELRVNGQIVMTGSAVQMGTDQNGTKLSRLRSVSNVFHRFHFTPYRAKNCL